MEVTLNKNGWHRKMQEFVFKDAPRYNSLCPYFWFTVFCVIFTFIIPVVPFIKLLKLIFIGSGMLLSGINNHICIPMMNSIIRGMDDSEVIKGWACYEHENGGYDYGWTRKLNGEPVNLTDEEQLEWKFWRNDFTKVSEINWKVKERSEKRFIKWKSITPDWEAQIEAIKTKRKEEYVKLVEEMRLSSEEAHKLRVKRQEEKWEKERLARLKLQAIAVKAEQIKKRRQKMFTKIAVYTKWLAYVVVAAIMLVIFYGIYRLFAWIAKFSINWALIGNITLKVIITLVVLAVDGAIIYLIIKLVQKCELTLSDSKFLRACAKPLIWLFKGIWVVLKWTALELVVPFSLFTYKWVLLPIGGVFYGIWKGLGFIVVYLKSTKDGYCPAIIWEEEKNVNRS